MSLASFLYGHDNSSFIVSEFRGFESFIEVVVTIFGLAHCNHLEILYQHLIIHPKYSIFSFLFRYLHNWLNISVTSRIPQFQIDICVESNI